MANKQYDRDYYVRKINSSRVVLIAVAVFTVINLILLLAGWDTYFLFSAIVPYLVAFFGLFLTGKFPEEFYGEEYMPMVFYDNSVFIILVILAFIICGLYLLCYFGSKNGKKGWLIFALVLFIIDTVVLILYYGLQIGMLLNILFHAFVLGSLISGVSAYSKLKNLPPEEPIASTELSQAQQNLVNTPPLRTADFIIKHKILLEHEAYGHKIIYRRVKKVNELVIDGKVYDEYTALFERPHLLTANLDGHQFGAGMNELSRSYIVVDKLVAKSKLRLI